MSLPAAAKSYHTAWVTPRGGTPHPVRYAVDGGRLVCFGDGALSDLPDRSQVSVSIREIAGAGGFLVSSFGASLRRLKPDEVEMTALSELLEHVALGRTLDEVEAKLAELRATRRIVELVP